MEEDEFFKSLTDEEKIKRLRWYEKKYGAYIEKRGFHNWKNLFRKPTMYEWTILFMIIMALFIAWAYQRDIAVCRETIKKDVAVCRETIKNQTRAIDFKIPELNVSKIII